MWRGFPEALANYGLAIAEEWRGRGYSDTAWDYFAAYLETARDWDDTLAPPWLGDERLHSSHRAALLAKDPTHYGAFGWSEMPKVEYWWPT